MKIKWDIEEEKLIITTIVGVIANISAIIVSVYVLPFDCFEMK
jgi:hypothetical protein